MSVLVSTRVWQNSKQTGYAFILMLAIADIADDEGVAWPGIKRLAKKARVTERSVYRLISQLIADGELEVTPGGGRRKTNLYKVLCLSENKGQQNPDRKTGLKTLTPESKNPDSGVTKTLTPESQNPDSGVTRLVTTHHIHVKDTSGGSRPIRKRIKKLDDLTTNEYFRWLIYEHAPHVDLELALREFVNYCASKGVAFKDYAAAFENSLLRQEAWWLKENPDTGPDELMYGDFKPDNSPSRQAYRKAYRAWMEAGEQGKPPNWQAFEYLNKSRGTDV